MEINEQKVDEISLALLYLTTFKDKVSFRAWKSTVGMFWIACTRTVTLMIPAPRPNQSCLRTRVCSDPKFSSKNISPNSSSS